MTRVTDSPEELEGGEFTRVHMVPPDVYSGTFWEDVNRLRHARTAWRIAKQLGQLIAERPPPI